MRNLCMAYPAAPPVLLLGNNGEVIGVEWEAADVGQGPMQMFGQTIQIQPGHPGAEEPHYMLHGYFERGRSFRCKAEAVVVLTTV